MTNSYSHTIINKIYSADPELLGVQLAKRCVALNIPVDDVAEHLGVSPMTVRAWFYGTAAASAEYAERITDILKKLS